jgi:hypothetical protein
MAWDFFPPDHAAIGIGEVDDRQMADFTKNKPAAMQFQVASG